MDRLQERDAEKAVSGNAVGSTEGSTPTPATNSELALSFS